MDRRAFVRSLIAAGLAASVDTDRLLWTPGERKVFIPKFTEAQRAQWLSFCNNRDLWLKWFADSQPGDWPEETRLDILRRIELGHARAKELGLDERLHRFKTETVYKWDALQCGSISTPAQ